MIKSIQVEGKDTEEAIKIGLKKLNLPKEKVEIKILTYGTKGLFGMKGSKKAKVKLTSKE